jgi:hypothetical protein
MPRLFFSFLLIAHFLVLSGCYYYIEEDCETLDLTTSFYPPSPQGYLNQL